MCFACWPREAPCAGGFGAMADNLQIQGLPEGCTDDDFRQMFAQYATWMSQFMAWPLHGTEANVLACKVVPAPGGKA